MVIAIEITNKVGSKSLPRQTLFCQPKAGNTAVMRSKADDEFAFDAGITGKRVLIMASHLSSLKKQLY